jgi:hypothetical protein
LNIKIGYSVEDNMVISKSELHRLGLKAAKAAYDAVIKNAQETPGGVGPVAEFSEEEGPLAKFLPEEGMGRRVSPTTVSSPLLTAAVALQSQVVDPTEKNLADKIVGNVQAWLNLPAGTGTDVYAQAILRDLDSLSGMFGDNPYAAQEVLKAVRNELMEQGKLRSEVSASSHVKNLLKMANYLNGVLLKK